MLKIDILGRGNVGWHLAKAFDGKADVVNVNPRTLEGLRIDSDIYLISVSDNAVEDLARRLHHKLYHSETGKTDNEDCGQMIVAHTSGSVPAGILSFFPRYGVFYPLQTFTVGRALNYSDIPFFIEGNSAEVTECLMKLAGLISQKVLEADSDLRRELHIASVFSCNFVNHLWALSNRYLKEKGIDFSLLYPLILETVSKINGNDPDLMQTGPASRGDTNVIARHIAMLDAYPEMRSIYTMLSESIMKSKSESKKI